MASRFLAMVSFPWLCHALMAPPPPTPPLEESPPRLSSLSILPERFRRSRAGSDDASVVSDVTMDLAIDDRRNGAKGALAGAAPALTAAAVA